MAIKGRLRNAIIVGVGALIATVSLLYFSRSLIAAKLTCFPVTVMIIAVGDRGVEQLTRQPCAGDPH